MRKTCGNCQHWKPTRNEVGGCKAHGPCFRTYKTTPACKRYQAKEGAK